MDFNRNIGPRRPFFFGPDQTQSSGSRTVNPPHIVIVGAGFGGLEAAKALARTPAAVTIIDRQNHHCFQPLLYQVATAALSPADIAWPVRSILSRQSNARVVMAEVSGIDLSARQVITNSMPPLPYDFLVLATGAMHSYFGHDEWAPFAPGLKRVEDATEIRRRLLIAFEKAEVAIDARERQDLLSFVIVGGGPTGIELAGAAAEIARYALVRDFRCIDPRASRIVLVEAGPRILPALPEALSAYAQSSLERMGVTVRTSTMVTACDEKGVVVATGERIPALTVIWAAGVKASPAAAWIKADCDRAGHIKVNPDLSIPDQPNVFAIGDTATVFWNERTVPGIAPAAKQMGRYVGQLVARRIAGRAEPRAFNYRHYGDLATIGRKSAVVSIGRLRLKGWIAWVFWSVAHIYFLIGARNRLSVAFDWLWDYLTFQRGARLIIQAPNSTAAVERRGGGHVIETASTPATSPVDLSRKREVKSRRIPRKREPL
ncbi:FAD-dependent pyridine nucleotide-disulfide oxidoreductase [Nitrobacter hamburgensis X14]|uniref:NADH:ubiquinone reductase (non-electrogenic) n=1 Tax=Nitrobacter hamburgensis (strain DSM 10229 / NCIMB 13809 / X14) TaxID=323097 RepID=Q1QMZ5_NITHX|nr:NAD(P)/FAD-dependent oxidoreductase [Nitrobacter hamburgensis]ABE62402.1 FAD-dependent pyridine nucleotide-disulfide oxidoreductase [Nitrobacter hamburgensis X14]